MRILKLLWLPLLACGAILATLAMRAAMRADASPLMQLATPPTSTPPVTAAAAPTPATVPVVPEAAEVKKLDALHQYAVDAILSLTPPYAERNIETPEARRARWTTFAIECADAVEARIELADQAPYVLTLIWIAHRESLLARDAAHVGNQDENLAAGPWQIHEWKGMDRFRASTALDLLVHAPGAWSLPSPRPWLGLAADRGSHGVNRPSVTEYLAKHPYAAD